MVFNDREEAAFKLLEKLHKYIGEGAVVLGIPRGAMPMAKIIAEGLGSPLGAVLVHKIPHPYNAEFAIGSIGLSGAIHLSPSIDQSSIPESYIQMAAREQIKILKERQQKYGLNEINLNGRTVIIVDDGIATGETTIAAIAEVRAQGAEKVVVAAAVSATEAARNIKRLVDEFVVLDTPRGFFAVAQFFFYFPQVTDEQVIEMLHGGREVSI